jgi:hypothetical protein
VGSPRIWIGPNIGSLDMLDLLCPGNWPDGSTLVECVELYQQNLNGPTNETAARRVGPNISEEVLKQVSSLKSIEPPIRLAVEVPCIKDGQSTEKLIEHAVECLVNAQEAGARVRWVTLDEPMVDGMRRGREMGAVAREVEYFLNSLKSHSERPNLEVIDIEAWPDSEYSPGGMSTQEILDWIGVSAGMLYGFHLDIDTLAVEQKYGPPHRRSPDLKAELRMIQNLCEYHHLRFGLTLPGGVPGALTDREFHEGARVWALEVSKYLPNLDRIVVKSWQGEGEAPRVIPNNLPQDEVAASLVSLLRAVSTIWYHRT